MVGDLIQHDLLVQTLANRVRWLWAHAWDTDTSYVEN